MSDDARFEDARDVPLHLKARDTEDLQVLSALAQDAVFPASEMRWIRRDRRFALLINRFRWEDTPENPGARRDFERVQALLYIGEVTRVQVQGIRPGDGETVHSLLDIDFEAGQDGAGRVVLVLAGDGAVACDVEALEVTLKDVTQPYIAPSRKAPEHPA